MIKKTQEEANLIISEAQRLAAQRIEEALNKRKEMLLTVEEEAQKQAQEKIKELEKELAVKVQELKNRAERKEKTAIEFLLSKLS
uniref:V-type ATP synthase subunit H n=1 Tax=candidate division WOR-3 bacterium TaxID=2052148 RepID=A0A7V3KNQ7_UNCW3